MTSPGRIPADARDDDEEWMAFFRSLTDPDVDALLAGQPARARRRAADRRSGRHAARVDGAPWRARP